jgi:hypothetical protein
VYRLTRRVIVNVDIEQSHSQTSWSLPDEIAYVCSLWMVIAGIVLGLIMKFTRQLASCENLSLLQDSSFILTALEPEVPGRTDTANILFSEATTLSSCTGHSVIVHNYYDANLIGLRRKREHCVLRPESVSATGALELMGGSSIE